MKNRKLIYRHTITGGGSFILFDDVLIQEYVFISNGINFSSSTFQVTATTPENDTSVIIKFYGLSNTENTSGTISILGNSISNNFLNTNYTAVFTYNGTSWDYVLNVSSESEKYVSTSSLIDGSVTNDKLDNLSVGTSKLVDLSVNTDKLAVGSVDGNKLNSVLINGDGIYLNSLALSVYLGATNPGLEFASRMLYAKTNTLNSTEVNSNGIGVKINPSENVLTHSASGLGAVYSSEYFTSTSGDGLLPVIKEKIAKVELASSQILQLFTIPLVLINGVVDKYIRVKSVTGIMDGAPYSTFTDLTVYSDDKTEAVFRTTNGLSTADGYMFNFAPVDEAQNIQTSLGSNLYITSISGDPTSGTGTVNLRIIYEELDSSDFI